jgi:hypothetical protein
MNRRLFGVIAFVLSLSVAGSAGAVSLSGPITISSGCCSAPRNTSYTFDPNGAPVEVSGWVDVSDLAVGSAIFLGFVDKQRADIPASTFMSGAYVYISRASATTLWIGPSDGNLAGEIVQEFDSPTNETYVTFTAQIGLGQISLDWMAGAQSGSLVDTYGVVKTLNNTGAYAWDEFEYGAYLAVDLFANTPLPGTVDFEVSAVPEPSTAILLGAGVAMLARGARRNRA